MPHLSRTAALPTGAAPPQTIRLSLARRRDLHAAIHGPPLKEDAAPCRDRRGHRRHSVPQRPKDSDRLSARIEHDEVLMGLMSDDTVLLKQIMDNASFKRWLTDIEFLLTYESVSTS